MSKLGVVVWVCFAVHVIWGEAFAAEPVIRSVELTSFGGDISRIGSLYNSSWSVVGKCCPVGQVYRSDFYQKNRTNSPCRDPLPTEMFEYSPKFSAFNQSGVFKLGEPSAQFYAVIGDPCRDGMYNLTPESAEEDKFSLLANGSIFLPKSNPRRLLTPGLDYCMENIPGQNLTVFVCFPPELKVVTADTRLAFYAVGLLTSVPFLLATILSYSITHQLRDVYGMSLCCYAGCLAIAFFTLAILQLGGHMFNESNCDSIAFVIQFAFIACFFWLNVMCVEMCLLVRWYGVVGSGIRDGRPNSNRIFFYYSIWGWGFPAILIVVSLIRNFKPIIPWTYVKRSGSALPSCWYGLDKTALPYFYVPVGLQVLANAVIFTMTGIQMARTQRSLDRTRLARNEASDRENRRVFRELRVLFVATLVLYLIMGINWAMELVSVFTDSDLLAWSIFDFVNALQGVLVFGLFVLRKPARTLFWRRVRELTGARRSVVNDFDDTRNTEMTLLPISNNNTAIVQPQRLNQ